MPALLVHELDIRALEDRFKVIDDFESLSGWSISGAGATQALDLANYRQGVSGYKMTVPVSIAGVSQKSLGPNNYSGVGSTDEIRFWLYVDDASRVSSASIQFVDNQGDPVIATHTITGF